MKICRPSILIMSYTWQCKISLLTNYRSDFSVKVIRCVLYELDQTFMSLRYHTGVPI